LTLAQSLCRNAPLLFGSSCLFNPHIHTVILNSLAQANLMSFLFYQLLEFLLYVF